MTKHPSEITPEEKERLQGKVDDLTNAFKEVFGLDFEAACVLHQKHADGPCPGVFIMTNGALPMKAAQAMIMQALIMMEGAMIQQHIDEVANLPTPQDTIN